MPSTATDPVPRHTKFVRVEDIVSAIAAQGIDIDRTQIGLEAPITAVGQFDVPVKLHAEVEIKIKVWVVEA